MAEGVDLTKLSIPETKPCREISARARQALSGLR